MKVDLYLFSLQKKKRFNKLPNITKSLGTDYFLYLDESKINITQLNEQHSLFHGVFKEFNEKIDFPKIEQYFIQTQLSKTTNTPLLSLENGQALISEYQYKKERFIYQALD